MAIEQAEQVDHGGQGFGLATLIAGKGVLAAAGQLCRLHLGELQFLANTCQVGALRGIHPVTEGQPGGFFRRVEIGKAIRAAVTERPVSFRAETVAGALLVHRLQWGCRSV